MISFQEVILKLQRYWADQGALIWQPYSEKVGAGTMNPATFLRVLGPEPWNVAYVEPSYRPDDGRYADNPNRMQMHTQFQVILKPDPGDPQERYLKSLEAIGIHRNEHDIRFVEDNWESPALGAWGLGWEVWLDGQEITQFTYFQQAGGVVLDVPAVEITYGLERIVMFLQEQRSVWDMMWDESVTYGEVLRDQEIDHCRYDFEIADIDRLGEMYDAFEQEALSALSSGLVVPALDYILRCSHTFNVLDARGTVGVTERAVFFKRMRDLARKAADAYLEQRDKAGYPWVKRAGLAASTENAGALMHLPLSVSHEHSQPSEGCVPMIFELGVEELPPEHVTGALDQLAALVSESLKTARLDHRGLHIWGTPRRLIIAVDEMSAMQNSEERLVKGPPAKAAFDAAGQPTSAAIGFARSKGVDVADLQVREIDGGQYVVALQQLTGQPAAEILAQLIPSWISALRFPRSMRWNASGAGFSRPIRWIMCMLGEAVIPFEYAGVTSGRLTYGPRPAGSPEIALGAAGDYASTLETYGVILDQERRMETIREQAEAVVKDMEGVVQIDAALLQEITHLVEVPTAILGKFDKRFLALPQDVLVAVMKKHQRYFPVRDQRGRLLPYFVTIRNGGALHADRVVQGNEDVIRARYADAAYFYNQDCKRPLEDFRAGLSTLTFQTDLGSMLEKSHRIEELTEWLSARLALSSLDADMLARAAFLSKADLATKMVVEMTSLQGIMGREYAKRSGESPAVAQAIFEQYLPRQAGDIMPQSDIGRILGIADRVDSLAGLFAVGMAPTGSADPYGLRRSAAGLVQILADSGLNLSLNEMVQQAAQALPLTVGDAVISDVVNFIIGRQRVMLRDAGYRFDSVEAILNVQGDMPAKVPTEVVALETWQSKPEWAAILQAFARCARIVRDQPRYALDAARLVETAEKRLYDVVERLQRRVRREGTVDTLMTQLQQMTSSINAFFDETMVMAEDQSVRQARIALLQQIVHLADGIVDFTVLEGF